MVRALNCCGENSLRVTLVSACVGSFTSLRMTQRRFQGDTECFLIFTVIRK